MAGDPHRLLRVGKIVRAHGIHGEVTVRPDEASSTTLLSQKDAFLKAPSGRVELVVIEAARTAHQAVLMRFAACPDRTAAEKLVGREVLLPRDRLPDLEPGEFYAEDLVGLAVTSVAGERLGTVERVSDAGGVPVLEVVGSKAFQVPLVDSFVKKVDVEVGVIVVEPPEEE
jgi:16S rRNA processing protein RimM